MKLRITISKYHSWNLCEASPQIMLLPTQKQTSDTIITQAYHSRCTENYQVRPESLQTFQPSYASSSILNRVYFDSWSWKSFVSTCDVFNCLFPLNVQSEIQLLSRVFCYSWLICLLGFWLRNTSLWQSRKSDFGWHRFRFSPIAAEFHFVHSVEKDS